MSEEIKKAMQNIKVALNVSCKHGAFENIDIPTQLLMDLTNIGKHIEKLEKELDKEKQLNKKSSSNI